MDFKHNRLTNKGFLVTAHRERFAWSVAKQWKLRVVYLVNRIKPMPKVLLLIVQDKIVRINEVYNLIENFHKYQKWSGDGGLTGQLQALRQARLAVLDSASLDLPTVSTDNNGEYTSPAHQPEMTTLTSVLSMLKTHIDSEGRKNIVNVDRGNILDGGCRAFQRTRFNHWAPLSVAFAGEQGIDNGGPTREFLQLTIVALRDSNIFEGPVSSKSLALDYRALQKGLYETAGKIIAYSFVHGGPNPGFLSPVLYIAIAKGVNHTEPGINDIMDYETREIIKKIADSIDLASFQKELFDIKETVALAGCLPLTFRLEDKPKFVTSMCHFLAIGRVSVALEQFQKGLMTCSVLEQIRLHPEIFQSPFTMEDDPLDALSVESFLTIPSSAWSDQESNKYRAERRTQGYWRDFLQDLEEMDKLEDLLQFVTGLRTVPILGMVPSPSTSFGHYDPDDSRWQFPMANTCANTLRIPVVEEYEIFKTNMLRTLEMVTAFTNE
ncbi:G2/M phase-specific E3 ubiquitin-protein ligase-like [Argopecten irradians]|uniref:G2/M phase-specific E3 ubiquitin-protein ligase-like n=1 Tax=Argopecten irradians TaxID=31199 RepID=UPI00370FBFCC